MKRSNLRKEQIRSLRATAIASFIVPFKRNKRSTTAWGTHGPSTKRTQAGIGKEGIVIVSILIIKNLRQTGMN